MSNIAKIRLAPGEISFFDETNNLYLTLGRPTACVCRSMNTSKINKAIKDNKLILVSGTLLSETNINNSIDKIDLILQKPDSNIPVKSNPKTVKTKKKKSR